MEMLQREVGAWPAKETREVVDLCGWGVLLVVNRHQIDATQARPQHIRELAR